MQFGLLLAQHIALVFVLAKPFQGFSSLQIALVIGLAAFNCLPCGMSIVSLLLAIMQKLLRSIMDGPVLDELRLALVEVISLLLEQFSAFFAHRQPLGSLYIL